MKKVIILAVVAVMMLSLGLVAFADTTENEAPAWFTEMLQWKRDQVKKAVEDKTITQEQAASYNERFEQMEEFHKENGFNFPGGCGFGGGMGRGARGFGGGMMRGFQGAPAPTANTY